MSPRAMGAMLAAAGVAVVTATAVADGVATVVGDGGATVEPAHPPSAARARPIRIRRSLGITPSQWSRHAVPGLLMSVRAATLGESRGRTIRLSGSAQSVTWQFHEGLTQPTGRVATSMLV